MLADYSPTFSKHVDPRVTAFIVDKESVAMGIRSDIRVKILTEATVNGVNLAETDQVGVRFYARYAYVLKNDAAVFEIGTPLGS